ncbi:MAG: hypothetical protein V2I46_12200 [Bacteroides sp.]|jgi:hypothetical protein|nr:hypothetical protein [Bacteroides sp.]
MSLTPLTPGPELEAGSRLHQRYVKLQALLAELDKRGLPEALALAIDQEIMSLNAAAANGKAYKRRLAKTHDQVLKMIREKLGWVPKNYYRNLWMALGLAVFGIPLGMSLGISLGSMAFLGIGFPMGIAIGIAIGTNLDQKAAEEGKQLDSAV